MYGQNINNTKGEKDKIERQFSQRMKWMAKGTELFQQIECGTVVHWQS